MATARIVAGQSGKPNISSTFFTFEEIPPVHHRRHHHQEDSATVSSFSSDRSVSFKLDLGRVKKSEDGEIDIFPAEKYFSGDIAVDSISPRLLTPSIKEADTISRTKSVGTPSICSQSSRNSRSALLWPNKKELSPPTPPKSIRSRRFGKIFRCSCSGDKSVKVEANGSNPSNSPDQIRGKRINLANMDPPIYSTVGRAFKDTKGAGNPNAGFGSPVVDLQVRNTGNDEDDDNRSESSSDLFEIESFNSRYPQFHPTSRAMSEAIVTAYAPSEASIEWSIATASAANFSDWIDEPPKPKKPPAAPRRSQRSGFFNGCTSSRAVDVSSTAYRLSEKGGNDKVIKSADFVDQEKTPVFRRYELQPGNRQVVEAKSAGIGRDFGRTAASKILTSSHVVK